MVEDMSDSHDEAYEPPGFEICADHVDKSTVPFNHSVVSQVMNLHCSHVKTFTQCSFLTCCFHNVSVEKRVSFTTCYF